MPILRLATDANNAACDAVADLIDAGVAEGVIQIRSGTQPATANLVASGTLLGTLSFADPAFGDAVAGVATAGTIVGDPAADATGVAGYARILDSAGATVLDVDITATGGGGTIELNTVNITAGQSIDLTSFTLTQPPGN